MGVPDLTADFLAMSQGAPGSHEKVARKLQSILTALCSETGIDPEKHVDTSGPGRSAVQPKPQPASLAVKFLNPSWDIQITNPQYLAGQSATQIQQLALANKNKRFTEMKHQLQLSPTKDFSAVPAANSFPISTQTHYTPTRPAGSWWRLRSTSDGFNWNDWSSPITG